jgi:hypothetical protein
MILLENCISKQLKQQKEESALRAEDKHEECFMETYGSIGWLCWQRKQICVSKDFKMVSFKKLEKKKKIYSFG